jgi:hypothetical protein
VHAALARSPHLISSSVERLRANAAQLQLALPHGGGAADADGSSSSTSGTGSSGGLEDAFVPILVKAPRLLSTRTETLGKNFQYLKELLDCSDEKVRGQGADPLQAPSAASQCVLPPAPL